MSERDDIICSVRGNSRGSIMPFTVFTPLPRVVQLISRRNGTQQANITKTLIQRFTPLRIISY